MLFQSADAFFTVVALSNGAIESNLAMNELLKWGFSYFLFYKLIAANLMILFIGFVGRRYLVGRIGLSFVVSVYALLTCYHLVTLGTVFLIGSAL
jgi:hypothetical protein